MLASTCSYTPTVPKYMFSSSHVIATVNLIRQARLFTFVKHICSHGKHICSAKFSRRTSSAAMRPPQYMFSSSHVIANVNHIR